MKNSTCHLHAHTVKLECRQTRRVHLRGFQDVLLVPVMLVFWDSLQEPVKLMLVGPVWTDQQINIDSSFEFELDGSFGHSGFLVVTSKCLPEEILKWVQPFLEQPVALCNNSITCNTCPSSFITTVHSCIVAYSWSR